MLFVLFLVVGIEVVGMVFKVIFMVGLITICLMLVRFFGFIEYLIFYKL